jgi:Uma2 family endonuclease
MSMPNLQRRRWTRVDVERLIDANQAANQRWMRYELVDGELLVTPGPRPVHQVIVGEFFALLREYLLGRNMGQVLLSPSDVQLESESYLQPDVYVVPTLEAALVPRADRIHRVSLAIEVLSPRSERIDRGRKRNFYQRHVPEYWIVDGVARSVERWRFGQDRSEAVAGTIEWSPAAGVEPLVIDLAALFARVLQD